MILRTALASVAMLGMMALTARAQPKVERVTATHTSAASGKEMFDTYCAVCHGAMGKGDGPAANAMKKAPANLTQLAAKNGGTFPADRVSQYITGAETLASHGSRDMPIWGTVFKALDRDSSVSILRTRNLTEYVKSLQAK